VPPIQGYRAPGIGAPGRSEANTERRPSKARHWQYQSTSVMPDASAQPPCALHPGALVSRAASQRWSCCASTQRIRGPKDIGDKTGCPRPPGSRVGTLPLPRSGGDPAAGSPTATLLRLLPPWGAGVRPNPCGLGLTPTPLGWSDGQCVQGAGTYSPRDDDARLLGIPRSRGRVAALDPNCGGV